MSLSPSQDISELKVSSRVHLLDYVPFNGAEGLVSLREGRFDGGGNWMVGEFKAREEEGATGGTNFRYG